jgi:hypothetical protein
VVREHGIVERAVFTGGLPGCGKSLLTPILGSLAKVEAQKYEYILEHLCVLYLLGKIEEDAAIAMVRMLTDLDLYHMAMSRETNFRPTDLSSVFKNPNPWRYIRRLFLPGDAAALERMKREHPIANFLTHNVLAISPLLFKALGERARILNVVRHPLYMIKQWHLYIDRYGTDARDFTIWFDYKGHSVPFFALGWEERYLAAHSMDKAIFSIDESLKQAQRAMEGLSESQRRQILTIPFERFVRGPWPYLRRMEQLLETQVTRATHRELKRQNVPRRMIAQGIPEPIYRQYGWQPPKAGSSERDELDRRRQFAALHATREGMEVLDRMSREYEESVLLWTSLEESR